MEGSMAAVLDRYEVTAERGFLPERDPLVRFDVDRHDRPVANYLRTFDRLGAELPDRLADGGLRPAVESLPTPPDGTFESLTDRETVRLCLLAGFFASGYVNRIGADPVDRLPAGAAVPLYHTSRRLGRQPILSYDVLCLHNWRRDGSGSSTNPNETAELDASIEPNGPTDPDRLEAVQQFTHLDDERWFVTIHVAIEASAGPALIACERAQRAVREDDADGLQRALETIADSLSDQTAIMKRMTEKNDPEAFAHRYRPYYEGFDEIVYEGVEAFAGEPQTYRGGSGAQSSVLPSIDASLGVEHATTELTEKLTDIRGYMPESHRAVVDAFEEGPDIGPYVADRDRPDLTAAHNRCIDALGEFRRVHFGQVIQYIRLVTGETTGTGGTDYMQFLRVLADETEAQKV